MHLPSANNSPIVVEKISENTTDGILQVVFIVKGEKPKGDGQRTHCRGEFEINSEYSVSFLYSPNGISRELSNFVGISTSVSSQNFITHVKLASALITTDGGRSFQHESPQYRSLPMDVFYTLPKIAVVDRMLQHPDFCFHGNFCHFEIKVFIKIDPKENIVEVPTAEVLAKVREIRSKLHDPDFGNTGFIVGGVKMYAHVQVIHRHCEILSASVSRVKKTGMYYEYPDTYPQVFEKLLIDAYLKEDPSKYLYIDTPER